MVITGAWSTAVQRLAAHQHAGTDGVSLPAPRQVGIQTGHFPDFEAYVS